MTSKLKGWQKKFRQQSAENLEKTIATMRKAKTQEELLMAEFTGKIFQPSAIFTYLTHKDDADES